MSSESQPAHQVIVPMDSSGASDINPDAEEIYSYQREDGTIETASSAQEVFDRCPVMGEMAKKAPMQAHSLLELARLSGVLLAQDAEALINENEETSSIFDNEFEKDQKKAQKKAKKDKTSESVHNTFDILDEDFDEFDDRDEEIFLDSADLNDIPDPEIYEVEEQSAYDNKSQEDIGQENENYGDEIAQSEQFIVEHSPLQENLIEDVNFKSDEELDISAPLIETIEPEIYEVVSEQLSDNIITNFEPAYVPDDLSIPEEVSVNESSYVVATHEDPNMVTPAPPIDNFVPDEVIVGHTENSENNKLSEQAYDTTLDLPIGEPVQKDAISTPREDLIVADLTPELDLQENSQSTIGSDILGQIAPVGLDNHPAPPIDQKILNGNFFSEIPLTIVPLDTDSERIAPPETREEIDVNEDKSVLDKSTIEFEAEKMRAGFMQEIQHNPIPLRQFESAVVGIHHEDLEVPISLDSIRENALTQPLQVSLSEFISYIVDDAAALENDDLKAILDRVRLSLPEDSADSLDSDSENMMTPQLSEAAQELLLFIGVENGRQEIDSFIGELGQDALIKTLDILCQINEAEAQNEKVTLLKHTISFFELPSHDLDGEVKHDKLPQIESTQKLTSGEWIHINFQNNDKPDITPNDFFKHSVPDINNSKIFEGGVDDSIFLEAPSTIEYFVNLPEGEWILLSSTTLEHFQEADNQDLELVGNEVSNATNRENQSKTQERNFNDEPLIQPYPVSEISKNELQADIDVGSIDRFEEINVKSPTKESGNLHQIIVEAGKQPIEQTLIQLGKLRIDTASTLREGHDILIAMDEVVGVIRQNAIQNTEGSTNAEELHSEELEKKVVTLFGLMGYEDPKKNYDKLVEEYGVEFVATALEYACNPAKGYKKKLRESMIWSGPHTISESRPGMEVVLSGLAIRVNFMAGVL